jgi:hypothetical protein
MMLNSINFFGGETEYPNSPIIIIFSTYLMPPIPGGGCARHRPLPASQRPWSSWPQNEVRNHCLVLSKTIKFVVTKHLVST